MYYYIFTIIYNIYYIFLCGFPCDPDGKESDLGSSLGWEWQPTPTLLLGEFHGQRSLVGCSPWGCEESDMAEQLTLSLCVI